MYTLAPLITSTAALQGVLNQLKTLLSSIPLITSLDPKVSQQSAALTPKVLELVAGVNSMNPGTIPVISDLLNSIANLLKSLTGGI